MSERRDVLVSKSSEAVFIQSVPMRLFGMLVSPLGVLKSLPGVLLPGLVILFLVGFRGTPMRVRCIVVQLGGSLMILVM